MAADRKRVVIHHSKGQSGAGAAKMPAMHKGKRRKRK
jgi:hypothetical protein